MHDGYIYTLAICGSAAASTPAPAVVNAMLAALPPVKRAALLGEVVMLNTPADKTLHDPLIDQVVPDMTDAEILLLVTPLLVRVRAEGETQVRLPARLEDLLRRAAPLVQAGQLRGKLAALVGVDTSPAAHEHNADSSLDRIVYRQTMLAPLQRFCVDAGIEIVGAAIVPAADAAPAELEPTTAETVSALAQRAYQRARQQLPHALPHQL